MVLVICETRERLRRREHRQTGRDNAVNGLAVLQQADHIVRYDPSAFHSGVAAPYPHATSLSSWLTFEPVAPNCGKLEVK